MGKLLNSLYNMLMIMKNGTCNKKGFLGGSDGKESACNAGDLGSISGLGRSAEGGHGNPLQYSCLENPHGQRRLAGYSPWGHKESDMTEQLTLSLLLFKACRKIIHCTSNNKILPRMKLSQGLMVLNTIHTSEPQNE